MTSDLNMLVSLAQSGPLVAVQWLPTLNHYSDPTFVFALKTDGQLLCWFPALASNATGELVRQVVQVGPEALRVDFATQEPLSAVFRRPIAPEAANIRTWLARQRPEILAAQVDATMAALRARPANTRRDKLFAQSYWLAFDHRTNKDVPAGIVTPTIDGTSLEWIAMPGWESDAYSRNRSMAGPVADPVGLLTELAERPGQNHSISYPEFVRASDWYDAVAQGLGRQRRTLVDTIGNV